MGIARKNITIVEFWFDGERKVTPSLVARRNLWNGKKMKTAMLIWNKLEASKGCSIRTVLPHLGNLFVIRSLLNWLKWFYSIFSSDFWVWHPQNCLYSWSGMQDRFWNSKYGFIGQKFQKAVPLSIGILFPSISVIWDRHSSSGFLPYSQIYEVPLQLRYYFSLANSIR